MAVSNGRDREPDYIDCVAWNKQAEFAGRNFTKGTKVIVSGPIKTRKYTDRNGQTRKSVEIWTNASELAGEPKRSDAAPPDEAYVQPEDSPAWEIEDWEPAPEQELPF